MSALGALREALRTDVIDVAPQVLTYLPETISPPIVLMLPGAPYVEAGDTYGSYLVRYALLLIVPNGDNAKQTADLDTLLGAVLAKVGESDRFDLERVEQPVPFQSGGATYLAQSVEVLAHDDLGGP